MIVPKLPYYPKSIYPCMRPGRRQDVALLYNRSFSENIIKVPNDLSNGYRTKVKSNKLVLLVIVVPEISANYIPILRKFKSMGIVEIFLLCKTVIYTSVRTHQESILTFKNMKIVENLPNYHHL